MVFVYKRKVNKITKLSWKTGWKLCVCMCEWGFSMKSHKRRKMIIMNGKRLTNRIEIMWQAAIAHRKKIKRNIKYAHCICNTLQWDKQQNDLSFLPNIIISMKRTGAENERNGKIDSIKAKNSKWYASRKSTMQNHKWQTNERTQGIFAEEKKNYQKIVFKDHEHESWRTDKCRATHISSVFPISTAWDAMHRDGDTKSVNRGTMQPSEHEIKR